MVCLRLCLNLCKTATVKQACETENSSTVEPPCEPQQFNCGMRNAECGMRNEPVFPTNPKIHSSNDPDRPSPWHSRHSWHSGRTVPTFRLDGGTVPHQKMPWHFQKPHIFRGKFPGNQQKKELSFLTLKNPPFFAFLPKISCFFHGFRGGMVGTARTASGAATAVRAACSGATSVVGRPTAHYSARCTGGDIAARCPYQEQTPLHAARCPYQEQWLRRG